MSRIGVFVCHCGENISRTVDCKKVAESLGEHPGVVHAVDYKYMCSDPGQTLIKQAIQEKKLDRVVVAACSPHMHERTFRKAVSHAGMNPYMCEMANIREHCSWIHENRDEATAKATELAKAIAEKVKHNRPLEPIRIPVTRRALVIGGGIAGIQAALDIADGGCEVILVEKEPSIGGHMSQLSETFPTLDCSQCILTPRMVEVYQHPRIKLMTYSEVDAVDGYIGNFTVKIRKKARSVDESKCTGCGDCIPACPLKRIPNEFEPGLGQRTAIYVPFAQAVPNVPVIDRSACSYFKGKAAGKAKKVCGHCAPACGKNAIDLEQEDSFVTESVGAIVVATGYQLYSIAEKQTDPGLKGYGEYGYGTIPDVIDGLQFERLASASGPTGGKILRPSDGKEPKNVVFLQCVGSRDKAKGIEYCSKICCMYTAKHTILYSHKVHGGKAHVFYMHVRAAGKGYEEFTRRAIEETGATYLRGRVSKMWREGDVIKVQGYDTLSNRPVTIDADMVVLATAMRPQPGVKDLLQKLSVSYDHHGFVNEAHPKLRPVETNTAGVFVAGACQAPRDIPDTVAMASAVAGKVLALLSNDQLEREPAVAIVNKQTCVGCMQCQEVCAYGAVERKAVTDRAGNVLRYVAEVNKGVCQGCGTCQANCRSKSIELETFTDPQVYAAINALAKPRELEPGPFKPRIVAFVCNWCTYTGADLAGTSRLQMSADVLTLRLPCTGRIDPLFIVKAFERGADGVIVSGCHPGDCHYTSGNYHARRRFAVSLDFLKFLGIDERRITFSWVSASEGKKWADIVNDVSAKVRELGPFAEYPQATDFSMSQFGDLMGGSPCASGCSSNSACGSSCGSAEKEEFENA